MIGKHIGNYLILEKIGEGGMGVVYRAEDQVLKRTVAIKVMNPRDAAQSDLKKRFLREAKTASSLNHRHITQIYQMIEQDGINYIVMEYVNGPSLHARLKKEGTISFAEAISIARQVAQALDAAQAEGLVHRDIKPGNIAFDQNGVVKLLDFGLAKWHKPSKSRDVYETTTGETVVGTVSYMSPEIALQGQVDVRSDLFSLGIVLYEMVTGKTPFQGNNNIEVLYEITRPQPPILEVQGLPPDIITIISRMLEKDPRDRYQSAQALLLDLEKVEQALLTGRTRLRRKLFRRRRLVVWLLTSSAVIVLGLTAFYFLTWEPRRMPSTPMTAMVSPAVTVLPIINKTGDESLSKLSLPLTHLLLAGLRHLRSVDVLDFDRLVALPDILNKSAEDRPDPGLYRTLRQIRVTAMIVRPLIFRIGGTWQAIVEFRDPSNGALLDSRTCRQVAGDDPEASLGPLLDCITREIAGKFGGATGETPLAPVSLPPERLRAQQYFAEGVQSALLQEHLKARDAFQKALQADPKDPITMIRLSEESRVLGYEEESVRYARMASGLINESMNIAQGYEIDAQLAVVTYQYDRAREILQKLVALYPQRPEYPYRLGEVEHMVGRYKQAEEQWQSTVKISPEYTPSILALAGICSEQARFAESIGWYQKAAKIFEAAANQEGQAAVLCGMSDVDYGQSKFEDGRKKLEIALEIYKKRNHPFGIATCTSAIGLGYYKMGDSERSRQLFLAAIAIFRSVGNIKATIEQQLRWCSQLLSVEDDTGTLKVCENSLLLAQKLNSRPLIAQCKLQLGRVLYYLNRFEESEKNIRETIDVFREIGSKRDEVSAICELVSLYYLWGHFDRCLDLASKGIFLAQSIGEDEKRQYFLTTISEVSYFRSAYVASLKIRNEDLAKFRTANDLDDVAWGAFNTARVSLALGDLIRCASLLDEAKKYFLKIDNKKMLGLALICQVEILREQVGDSAIGIPAVVNAAAKNLDSSANKAEALLGRSYRSLLCGPIADERMILHELKSFLEAGSGDIFFDVDLHYVMGDLCLKLDDRMMGLWTVTGMLDTANKLGMPEYGARASLLKLRIADRNRDRIMRENALRTGRVWYQQLLNNIPKENRPAFFSRRRIAELNAAFSLH